MRDLEQAQALFFAALEAQNKSDPSAAEALYRQALVLAPDRPSILNNLATVMHQQGKYAESAPLCERLTATHPEDAGAWVTLGNAQSGLGQTEQALISYNRALALSPGHLQALTNRARVLGDQGRTQEAIADYRLALTSAPGDPVLLASLSGELLIAGELESALETARQATVGNPQNSAAFWNCGCALTRLGRHAEALEALDRAARLSPQEARILRECGTVHITMQQYVHALTDFDRSLHLDATDPLTLCYKANALVGLGQPEEALAVCDQAAALRHDEANVYLSRGNAFSALGRTAEALQNFKHAHALAPEHANPVWNEALCRLLAGDFKQGWALYARGWDSGQRGAGKPRFEKPDWDGAVIKGTLLAWGEQGIGDQILHAGMLEELQGRARRLMAAVDARLIPLMQRSFPQIEFLPRADLALATGYDCQVAFGDLGAHFRNDWQDFPQNRPAYLHADAVHSRALRELLNPRGELLCGISWRSANPALGGFKSLALDDFSALIAESGVRFVDLQYGDTAEERHSLKTKHALELHHVEDIDNFHDIDALAALINACDLIISVSNTTVHLAGALGKPALVLLPHAQGRLWYWHEVRETSPWYPSCTLLRQPVAGDWGTVLRAAHRLLKAGLKIQ